MKTKEANVRLKSSIGIETGIYFVFLHPERVLSEKS